MKTQLCLIQFHFFDKGIVGVTEDKQHLIYSYQKLTEGNASEEFAKKEKDDERTF